MSMNSTPSGERIHIGIFGCRNAGKSSLINALTGQSLAIVSETLGTTTDPVQKAMELLPLGPVVMIDTPGLDDEGELGTMRVNKAKQVLNKTDIAIPVIDGERGLREEDRHLISIVAKKDIPFVVAINKSELLDEKLKCELELEVKEVLKGEMKTRETKSGSDSKLGINENAATKAKTAEVAFVSAASGEGIEALKELLGKIHNIDNERALIRDIIKESEIAILVVPIDKAAPKGRLILPQQMTIRDILDAGASAIVVKEDELPSILEKLSEKPAVVVTDSQVFAKVDAMTPSEIYLTSFSILMARYKGDLDLVVKAARKLDELKSGDRILIAEGCTHHRQCGDIGTQKLPAMIRRHCGFDVEFDFCSGTEFPEDLSKYELVVHCGACMLNSKEMKYRQRSAVDSGVAITNYGTAIAHMNGILERSLEIFADRSEGI